MNGKRAVRARHPNHGYLAIAELPDKAAEWTQGQMRFRFREGDLKAWPTIANAEVVAILEKSADDLGAPGHDVSFGWGRVNAFQAVSAARQTLSPPLPAAVIEMPPRRPRH